MPKMKTRKSITKRIKQTPRGKLLHRHAMSSHLKMAKSKKAILRHHTMSEISGKLAKKIKLLMG